MSKSIRQWPLSIGPLRAFEAVARLLNFRVAAEEMHLTQSAVSRQIKSLEDEIGMALFVRGTRHVELTSAGQVLWRAAVPALQRLDGVVRDLRRSSGRRSVRLSTFASFASLWLLPRLVEFQRAHPDIDIRVSAEDGMVELGDADVDLVLRHCHPKDAPPGALRLFGEQITPVASPWLVRGQDGQGGFPPLRTPADLAGHTLLEQEDSQPSSEYRSWASWLRAHAPAGLEPRRWLYLNYTYQEVQAALAGQGVALTRMPMVIESLQRGELVEPFGAARRVTSPYAYWLVAAPGAAERVEVAAFAQWVAAQAVGTRAALGEAADAPAA